MIQSQNKAWNDRLRKREERMNSPTSQISDSVEQQADTLSVYTLSTRYVYLSVCIMMMILKLPNAESQLCLPLMYSPPQFDLIAQLPPTNSVYHNITHHLICLLFQQLHQPHTLTLVPHNFHQPHASTLVPHRLYQLHILTPNLLWLLIH